MSGETYRPHHKRSSPVLTMILISSGGMTCRSPSTSLAPPVPPVSTQIMLPPFLSQDLRCQAPHLAFQPATLAGTAHWVETQDRQEGADATAILCAQCAFASLPAAARVSLD